MTQRMEKAALRAKEEEEEEIRREQERRRKRFLLQLTFDLSQSFCWTQSFDHRSLLLLCSNRTLVLVTILEIFWDMSMHFNIHRGRDLERHRLPIKCVTVSSCRMNC